MVRRPFEPDAGGRTSRSRLADAAFLASGDHAQEAWKVLQATGRGSNGSRGPSGALSVPFRSGLVA